MREKAVIPERETPPSGDASEEVPRHIVQSILRDHLADPTATLTDLSVRPFVATSSHSGNNTRCRVRIAWTAEESVSPGSAEWIIKRRQPGGLAEAWVGVAQPQEALAWQRGLLRPQALPAGFVTPFVGASVDPDGTGAWVAMTDVSTELAQYSSAQPLPGEVALARVKHVLDGLARFHAWWEQPQQQEKLAENSWLLSWEDKVWCNAATYVHVLGRESAGGRGKGWLVTEIRRANLQAFLEWLAPGDRQLWEELMVDGRPVLTALQDVPLTLIHGDPDGRHIGLSWSQTQVDAGQRGHSSPELVLIDWEVIGVGPAAFDAAYAVWWLPFICDPFQPCPEFCWSSELPEYYFDRYIAAGGRRLSHETFSRSFDLAGLLPSVAFLPARTGSTLRSLQGLASMRHVVGMPDELLLASLRALHDTFERMTERATRAARTWLA